MTFQSRVLIPMSELMAMLGEKPVQIVRPVTGKVPHPDAELLADYDGPEWADRDPSYLDEDEIIRRADASDERFADRRDRALRIGCRRI
jgi:hypothetical protein